MTLDEFEALTAHLLDLVPPRLLEGLNGGVMVRREARQRPGDPPDVYVLGEYVCTPALGCFICLYHGSFARVLGRERAAWEAQLEATLRHEIRHHVESRAGINDLVREDLEHLEGLRHRR